MNEKKFSQILKEISPSNVEIEKINMIVSKFTKKLSKPLRSHGKIFIGGSLAKKTLIKKERGYDIDIFVMFKNKNDISKKLATILKKAKIKYNVLKGSRNYFQINFQGLKFEIVPILEIKSVDEAENITDISPLHVKYLLKNENNNEKLADDIKLAKSFCYANDCYGAESYIKGFSGYAIEILIYYYGSFLKFIKEAAHWNLNKKIILDPEKHYKNQKEIIDNINDAKKTSPIIIIDPVQKERNITAALSDETLDKFIKACKTFIKNPNEKAFFKRKLDINKLKETAKKQKYMFISLETTSIKNKIDTAGAKLKKFFDFFIYSLKKEGFHVKKSFFDFDERTLKARYFFVIKNPDKEKIVPGPPISVEKKYIDSFKKTWKKTFIKNKRLYAKTRRKFSSLQELLKSLLSQIKEMGIKEIKII